MKYLLLLKTKLTEIEIKLPDTIDFITTSEFKWLTKLSFDARLKRATKNLETKKT